MGFYIYEAEENKAKLIDDNVKLAGYNLIYNILEERRIINAVKGLIGWHISEKDLVNKYAELNRLSQPEKYMLVVDLKPSVEGNISLYKPVMMQLIPVYSDEDATKVNFTKNKFPIPQDLDTRERVHTFLYLKGGTREGNWTWGGGGFVSAALLWPDATLNVRKPNDNC